MVKKSNHPRVLLALEWYSRELHRGIAAFAMQTNWVLDTQMMRHFSLPPNWKGDGVICMLGRGGELSRAVKRLNVPTVNIAWRDCPLNLSMVLHDDAAIGKTAAEHFIGNGFRNFAFYRSEDRTVAFDRMTAFAKAVRRAGLNYFSLDIAELKSRRSANPSWRQDWLVNKLSSLPRPLAVFAQNDDHATEILYACEAGGISVPEDVAILGCDNDELLCTVSSVPLSSIDSNQFELGFQAAKRLDNIIRRKRQYSRPLLIKPGRIFVRKSSDITAVTDVDVAAALAFIRDNIHRMITADDVVANSNVSRRKLYLAFEKELGRGIAREISRCKVALAESLITQGNLKLYKIANRCGFAGLQHMRNAFIRETGLSPSEFRRQNG